MKSVTYVAAGKKFKVKSMLIGAELWMHVNGKTYILDLRPKAKSKTGDSAKASGQIGSPMPGKILKVNYKAGDRVEANKTIIVMEAMKMEYSLTAPFSGILREINCTPLQQVELNQRLAFIEAMGDEIERKD